MTNCVSAIPALVACVRDPTLENTISMPSEVFKRSRRDFEGVISTSEALIDGGRVETITASRSSKRLQVEEIREDSDSSTVAFAASKSTDMYVPMALHVTFFPEVKVKMVIVNLPASSDGVRQRPVFRTTSGLNDAERSSLKKGMCYIRAIDDPLKIKWPTNEDASLDDYDIVKGYELKCDTLGSSVSIDAFNALFATESYVEVNYEQLCFAITQSLFYKTFVYAASDLCTKEGVAKREYFPFIERLATLVADFASDLIQEYDETSISFTSYGDFKTKLLEKINAQNASTEIISKDCFKDLIRILKRPDSPKVAYSYCKEVSLAKSSRVPYSVSHAVEFPILLAAFHDGSWKDDEERSVTFCNVDQKDLKWLKFMVGRVFDDRTFKDFFKSYKNLE